MQACMHAAAQLRSMYTLQRLLIVFRTLRITAAISLAFFSPKIHDEGVLLLQGMP